MYRKYASYLHNNDEINTHEPIINLRNRKLPVKLKSLICTSHNFPPSLITWNNYYPLFCVEPLPISYRCVMKIKSDSNIVNFPRLGLWKCGIILHALFFCWLFGPTLRFSQLLCTSDVEGVDTSVTLSLCTIFCNTSSPQFTYVF